MSRFVLLTLPCGWETGCRAVVCVAGRAEQSARACSPAPSAFLRVLEIHRGRSVRTAETVRCGPGLLPSFMMQARHPALTPALVLPLFSCSSPSGSDACGHASGLSKPSGICSC